MHLIGKCSFLVVHTIGICLTIDGILDLMTHDVLTLEELLYVCLWQHILRCSLKCFAQQKPGNDPIAHEWQKE